MFTKKSLLLILSIICISVFSYFIYNNVKYDYVASENDFNDKNAQNELYEYLIKENPEIAKHYQEQCTKDTVNAFYYDLDDDKIPEILGFANCNFYQGTIGTNLFVLKKTSKGCENLTFLSSLYPEYGIKILNHTTNSYHDIEVVAGHIPDDGSSVIPAKPMSVTYTFDGKNY